MAVCPMNFRYEAAFIVPVIMIGMFSVSAFLFGRQILVKWLGSDNRKASFVMFLDTHTVIVIINTHHIIFSEGKQGNDRQHEQNSRTW